MGLAVFYLDMFIKPVFVLNTHKISMKSTVQPAVVTSLQLELLPSKWIYLRKKKKKKNKETALIFLFLSQWSYDMHLSTCLVVTINGWRNTSSP